jgi:PAS domain S-box-containing protein
MSVVSDWRAAIMAMYRLVVTGILVAGIAVLFAMDRYYRADTRQDQARQLATSADKTKHALEVGMRLRIVAVEDLRAFIETFSSLPDKEILDRYASLLLENYPEMRALQYVDTDHTIRYTYPVEGNESALGLDLTTRPAAPFIQKAIETRRTTVSDPVVTVQGAYAVVACSPIFVEDRYLGIAQGVFEIHDVLDELSVVIGPGMGIELSDSAGAVFWKDANTAGDIASAKVNVNDSVWGLTLGWIEPNPKPSARVLLLIWGLGGATLISVLLAVDQARRRMRGLAKAVEEKTAEHRASEARFRVLFEQSADGIVVADAEYWTIDFVNPAICSMLGYHPEDLMGLPVVDIFPENSRTQIESELVAIARGKKVSIFDVPCLRKDRQISFADISAVSIQIDGKSSIVGFLRDITERKRVEAERSRLVMALEHAAESVVVTDAQGTVEYVNPAFEKLTGYHRDEILGKNPRILKSGEHDDAFYEAMRDTLTRGEVWSGHIVNRRKDGSLIEELTTISPVHDAHGDIVSYVAIERDVSEQRKFEDRERQTQKMEAIGTLAGGIAHDFNNILAAIIGYSELVLSDLDEDSQSRSDMGNVLNAANRAKSLVYQILTFSRRAEEARQPVDLAILVKEAMKLLRPSLPATIDIQTDIGTDRGLVCADPTQMHQVLMNLCTNAFHAMEETGGTLRISLREIEVDASMADTHPGLYVGAYVRLSVSDTGCGMDRQTQARVFEPFFTTKPQGKGTGMGLATVHGIVTAHGGAIVVYSEHGQGTKFDVYLPRSIEEVIHPTRQEEPVLGGTERILVLDDEEALARLLEKSLARFGYEVVAMTSSTAALAAIKANPALFDLLITDQTMPRMTGLQLVAELRSFHRNLPVILTTGFAEAAHWGDIEKLGISVVLTKPTKPSELAKAVRQVLDNPNGPDEGRGNANYTI